MKSGKEIFESIQSVNNAIERKSKYSYNMQIKPNFYELLQKKREKEEQLWVEKEEYDRVVNMLNGILENRRKSNQKKLKE